VKADETQTETQKKSPGRLVSAWRVLFGRSATNEQMLAEWCEYRLTFNSLLERFSALLARQAKAEKARLVAGLEVSEPPEAVSDKADLRRRAAAFHLNRLTGRNGLPNVAALIQPAPAPHPPEEEP